MDGHRTTELHLSHSEIAEVLTLTMRVGALMLRSGSASFRAEQVMTRLAESLGVERLDAYVTPTGIIATAYHGREHRTQIRRIPSIGVDMNRVVQLEKLSRNLPADVRREDIEVKLEAIEKAGTKYPPLMIILSVAIGCAAFAFILGGGPLEAVSAFIASAFAQFIRMQMVRSRFSPIPITVVCAAIATAISYALTQVTAPVAPSVGLEAIPRIGVIASVLLLVPGVPLVTSILDLTRLDFVSGAARGLFAFVLLASIAIGMLAILVWTKLPILTNTPTPLTLTPTDLLQQCLWGFLATLGFSVLFNVPRNTIFSCALVGAFGHALRYTLRTTGISNEVATFAGASFVGLVGYQVSVRYNLPRLVFTVTGIISMVPGIPSFEVLVYFSQGDVLGGIQNGVRALLITGAIAAGLTLARLLTDIEALKIHDVPGRR